VIVYRLEIPLLSEACSASAGATSSSPRSCGSGWTQGVRPRRRLRGGLLVARRLPRQRLGSRASVTAWSGDGGRCAAGALLRSHPMTERLKPQQVKTVLCLVLPAMAAKVGSGLVL
ncbi:hypothetical protein, partial [Anaeromyxobacter sp. PSR-1]|uniref:hypothetical protein n=1 Tax=Anaeromyxobacter sp. PSR-1 TaxID=1300915 RepID=UPI001ED9A726